MKILDENKKYLNEKPKINLSYLASFTTFFIHIISLVTWQIWFNEDTACVRHVSLHDTGQVISPTILRRLIFVFSICFPQEPGTGRFLRQIFMELPSRKDYPDYYQVILGAYWHDHDWRQKSRQKRWAIRWNLISTEVSSCLPWVPVTKSLSLKCG